MQREQYPESLRVSVLLCRPWDVVNTYAPGSSSQKEHLARKAAFALQTTIEHSESPKIQH